MPELTIETAQERILELEGELETLRAERETLSHNNETLAADLERARTLNQKLFERVSQSSDQADKNNDEDEEVLTCEEFAKTLTI